MRKPGRVGSGGKVEVVSVAGAKKAIFEADVVALVVDASTGATDHDAAIGGEADRAGRGVVILANKWDLVKDRGTRLRRRCSTMRRAGTCAFSITRRSCTFRPLPANGRPRCSRPSIGLPRFAVSAFPRRRSTSFSKASRPRTRRSARAESTCGSVRGANRDHAAVVCLLHERGDDVSLLVRALPDQQASRGVRFRRDADSYSGPPPRQRRRAAQGKPTGDGPQATYRGQARSSAPGSPRDATGRKPGRIATNAGPVED